MSVLTTVSELQRFAKACTAYANSTSSYNFRVEFHDSDDESGDPKYYTYTDGDTVVIHVPNPTTAMSERDAKIIKSGILHEILHTSEGTHDAQQLISDSGIGKLGQRDPLGHIWNVLEDHRIERLDCQKFEGDAFVLRDAYEIISMEMADVLKSGEMDLSEMEDDSLKMMGLRLADLVARESWMNLTGATEAMYEANPERCNEVATQLIDAGFDDRIRKTETVSEVIDLSKEIFEFLFDKDAEEHIEENQQQEQQQGEGQEGDGDEEGEQKAKAQQGEDEGQGEGEGKCSREIPVDDFDYLEYVRNKQKVPSSGSEPPSAGMHIDYSKYLESADKLADFDPCPMEDIGVANFKTGYYHDTPNDNVERLTRMPQQGSRGRGKLDNVFSSHGLQVNSLANKIRRLLQVQSQARWVGGATSGRIHRKSAYRAAMPTVGDGRWNREIFKRRHQDATLDVAVSVLCDFSGSMGGAKMAHAAFGGYILSDAIGRVLRVPTRVQTFSEHDEYTIMCVLKNWDEIVTEEDYKDRAARAVNTMEQNDDGSAILWTYEDLRRRPEKRKVLIVLSDGSPASSRPGDEMRYTQQVVSEIEESGGVECYGIGIMDRNVSSIYKEWSTINSPEEIEEAILQTVKRKLIV